MREYFGDGWPISSSWSATGRLHPLHKRNRILSWTSVSVHACGHRHIGANDFKGITRKEAHVLTRTRRIGVSQDGADGTVFCVKWCERARGISWCMWSRLLRGM